MTPDLLIKTLTDMKLLDQWKNVLNVGGKEEVVGTWYNMAMVFGEHAEGYMDSITYAMWELGLQAFDWEHLYDLLSSE